MSALALGRLLRLSLAPSAVADVAAGLVFAGSGIWPAGPGPFWLMGSSLCVYHGAMALNDWHDREHDARTRPSRPIPSRAVRPATALALAATLLLLGPLLALLHSRDAGLWSAGLAALAIAYNLVGRGRWIGPILLSLCRAGNLGIGLFFAQGSFAASIPWQHALLPLALFALYVLRVSQLGRYEDGEDTDLRGARPKALVLSASVMLMLVALLPPFESSIHTLGARLVSIALAFPASLTLGRAAFSSRAWTRADVERSMGLALRRFLMFAAALAALAWRPPHFDALIVAALILAGYAVAASLRKVFPPS